MIEGLICSRDLSPQDCVLRIRTELLEYHSEVEGQWGRRLIEKKKKKKEKEVTQTSANWFQTSTFSLPIQALLGSVSISLSVFPIGFSHTVSILSHDKMITQ